MGGVYKSIFPWYCSVKSHTLAAKPNEEDEHQCLYSSCPHGWRCTKDSRYIAVIYNTIVHEWQQLRWYNFTQTLHSRTTHHSSSARVGYWVPFVKSSKKYDRDISRAHGMRGKSVKGSLCENYKNVFTYSFILQQWYGTRSWNIFLWLTMTNLCRIVNTRTVDDLATQEALASSSMWLPLLSRILTT